MFWSNEKGLSLVELIAAVFIMAVLMAGIAPLFGTLLKHDGENKKQLNYVLDQQEVNLLAMVLGEKLRQANKDGIVIAADAKGIAYSVDHYQEDSSRYEITIVTDPADRSRTKLLITSFTGKGSAAKALLPMVCQPVKFAKSGDHTVSLLVPNGTVEQLIEIGYGGF